MIKDILREQGVRGLYRGLPGIWVKEVPGSFIYFGSYEASKMLVRHAAGDEHMHLSKYCLNMHELHIYLHKLW